MTVSLTSRDGNTALRPGDLIELRGAWQLERVPEILEARLFWFTSGAGTQDVGLVATRPIEASMHGEQTFRFRLADAPYSFSGRLITLQWAVELVADQEVARWEFTMSPTGEAIRLAEPSPQPRFKTRTATTTA